jgi:Predicted hydrolase of the alpha/beta-hydrolase fold
MTQDFINNFLPVTTMPMIFIYGENDPWTGCAIPDPTNPNIVKIIVPKGTHSDYINNEYYCPKETYQQICYAIYKYIKI